MTWRSAPGYFAASEAAREGGSITEGGGCAATIEGGTETPEPEEEEEGVPELHGFKGGFTAKLMGPREAAAADRDSVDMDMAPPQ